MLFRDRLRNLSAFYDTYVLAVVSIGYVTGELGHYLIGVTSKAIAGELHYGDISCQLSGQLDRSKIDPFKVPVECRLANNSDTCWSLETNGTSYCEWTYNGLGLDYQILAGPAFIAVFTIVGVLFGFAADKYNRVRMLGVATLVFGTAIFLSGTVADYWQLTLLRMVTAAGEAACNPMSTGILSDIFPEEKRALVLSVFNWGIYGGYGIAFPIGRYVPALDLFRLGWRVCYYGAGLVAVFFGVLTLATLTEPKREEIATDSKSVSDNSLSLWQVLCQPRMILLCVAASVRHCGGMCFAYNCDLYYRQYFPEYDLGWWLFAVTIGIGSVGVVSGGMISDRFVSKMGVQSRVACLAVSQLLATPFAFGSVLFEPTWAMITLGISYFFAEMWFGIVFAILVEIVPLRLRSTLVGIFLFVMNNVGGNLPILVDPVSRLVGYRESIAIFYAGFYGLSAILFFATMYVMEREARTKSRMDRGLGSISTLTAAATAAPSTVPAGHDNPTFKDTETSRF